MNLFWVCIISFSVFWARGCGSEKDTSKNARTVNYQSDTTDVSSDTIPQPPPPPPGLPPGQAKVKGKIIAITKYTEDTSSGYLTLKVDKVLGYGSSTPPIARNDSIRITSTNLEQDDIQIRKIVTATITYRLVLDDTGRSSRWTLIKLEKN